MPRFEKIETNPASQSTTKDMPPLEWLSANFVNPLVNASCVEPINAVAWTFDKATGQKQAHKLERLPVPTQFANTGSPEMVCQSIACGLGSVIPYALAGRLTGNSLRFAGATFKTEGALVTFAQSEKAAQIIGSGIYDGMKETHVGESHLRNGAAGAVNFAVLEYWKCNPRSKVADRFIAGMFGSLAHTVVARPDLAFLSKGKDVELDVGGQMLAGGLMNALLPGTQEGIRRLQDKATIKMGIGVPIDRYMKTSEMAPYSFSSKSESRLIEQNRWARIEPNAEFSNYHHGRDMISLDKTSTKSTFFHELQHRKEAIAGVAEPGFVRAASLLSKDTEHAWDVYKTVRQAQEIRAELANYHDASLPHYKEVVKELKKTIPTSSAAGGVPYINLWRTEFKEFQRSGGKYRPEAEFAARSLDRDLESEANKLHVRLSARQPHADQAISSVIARPDLKTEQITKVFRHINEFLDPRETHPIPLPLDRLAMQTLRLTAKPERVVQGYHPTCTPAALEYVTYTRQPENAANLISQVVRQNKYTSGDGTTITVNGLNVVPEQHWNRPFANQLFQTTAVNVHWQRKSDLLPWVTKDDHPNIDITPGKTMYQRMPTNQLNESPYRLIDFGKNPPEHIYDRLPQSLKGDAADPLMCHDGLNDINAQINGSAGGAISLPWDLSSPQQLNSLLRARLMVGRLPVVTVVDSRHKIFRDELSDGSVGGWHSVVIRSFDPKKNVVSLFNPWGKVIDDVSVKDVFHANKEYQVTGSHERL